MAYFEEIQADQGIGNAGSSPWAVSGTVSIGNVPTVNQGTNPWIVSGSVIVSNSQNLIIPNPIGVSGTVTANPKGCAASTITSVSGTTVSGTVILAANSSRLGATIFNNSSSNLYLSLGSGATTSTFVVILVPSAYYEVPFNYQGIISGVWASANGNALISELTP